MQRDRLTHWREDARSAVSLRLADAGGPRPLELILRRRFPDTCGAWPLWLRVGHRTTLWAATEPTSRPAGTVLAEFRDGRGAWPAISVQDDEVVFHFDPWAAAEHVTTEAYLPRYRPLYSRLPEPIRRLPGPLRLAGQHVIIPLQQWRHRDPDVPFPRFPREDAVEVLRALVQSALGREPECPLPGGGPVVVLTHDVDTGQGQRCVPTIDAQERQRGLRSCWYVAGDRYRVDDSLWDDVRAAGHEVGLHGAKHDGQLAFLGARRIARRLDRCAALVQRHEMEGFRSPALLMTDTLADVLRGRFTYDSSVPDTDVRAVAGPRRGCASLFPLFRRGLLQLPLTLPLDDRLLLLGHSPDGVFEVWRNKLDWVLRRGGMAVVTTHAEPHLGVDPGVLDAYCRLLDHITALGATTMLPREVAHHWIGVDGDG